MEFTCRLGTPSGEIVEGVYIAQSETHLRRELEEKGLHVLALRPRGGLGLPGFSLGRRKPKIARHEFLVFNQELATLLKAGMPLVQSLDILRTRLANPVFKAVLDDVHEKVRAGTALSEAFQAHGDLFPSVYTASLMAGERAGNLDAVLRRFVAYAKVVDTVRKKTVSALVYPAILIGLAIVLVATFFLMPAPAPQPSGFWSFYSADPLAIFFKRFALVTTILVLLMMIDYAPVVRQSIHGATHQSGLGEFFALPIFTCAGLMWMVSAIDFVMIFVSLELLSLCLYTMTAFNKQSIRSAEAALKYFLIGIIILANKELMHAQKGSVTITNIRRPATTTLASTSRRFSPKSTPRR